MATGSAATSAWVENRTSRPSSTEVRTGMRPEGRSKTTLETGSGKGKNTTLNYPLPAGTGMEAIARAFREDFSRRMKDYRPDLVIVSAGFDSRVDDPLGQFQLTDRNFAELTGMLAGIAGEFAENRLISVLEGGYNQAGLALAVATHVETLLTPD